MSGKLYGLGVGPGDPELLTLKAKRILEEVDLVCAPQASPDKDSLALQTVKETVDCSKRVQRLHFPMTSNPQELEAAWERVTTEVIELLTSGQDVALITIGDPLFYSTYSYILERVKASESKIEVETVPGVASLNAGSSRLNLPLTQGDEKLAVIPTVDDLVEVREALINFENIVLIKVSKNYAQLVDLLAELNLKEEAVFISRCGQPEEFITSDLDSLVGTTIDYLSLIIVKKR